MAVPALLSGASLVTGSNIRRVDMETANPVVTIDRAAIQQSGRLALALNLTLGDRYSKYEWNTAQVLCARPFAVENAGGGRALPPHRQLPFAATEKLTWPDPG